MMSGWLVFFLVSGLFFFQLEVVLSPLLKNRFIILLYFCCVLLCVQINSHSRIQLIAQNKYFSVPLHKINL